MRDLAALVVPEAGRLARTGDGWERYQLLDAAGAVVVPAAAYFAELQAAGCSVATIRSYGLDLLRWWRFLAAAGVAWDRATPAEARDFARWMQVADKRPACTGGIVTAAARQRGRPGQARGGPGSGERERGDRQAGPGRKYSRHRPGRTAETVLRVFYDFHLEAGPGPMVNPFPLDGSRGGRANAHHNPMEPFRNERPGRTGRGARRIPRRIPDELFIELFAELGSHRDRALVAFWVSTGGPGRGTARAAPWRRRSGPAAGHGGPQGQPRAFSSCPASPDAFVWLRLYQSRDRTGRSPGRDEPLWWTLRGRSGRSNYHAARAMFGRAEHTGANWTLHDLRHTAA